jgi:hypothetical protein
VGDIGENSRDRGNRGENGVRRGDKMIDIPPYIYLSQGDKYLTRALILACYNFFPFPLAFKTIVPQDL